VFLPTLRYKGYVIAFREELVAVLGKADIFERQAGECQNGTGDVEIQKQYFSDEANTGECV
jgi:hypothetical protein